MLPITPMNGQDWQIFYSPCCLCLNQDKLNLFLIYLFSSYNKLVYCITIQYYMIVIRTINFIVGKNDHIISNISIKLTINECKMPISLITLDQQFYKLTNIIEHKHITAEYTVLHAPNRLIRSMFSFMAPPPTMKHVHH